MRGRLKYKEAVQCPHMVNWGAIQGKRNFPWCHVSSIWKKCGESNYRDYGSGWILLGEVIHWRWKMKGCTWLPIRGYLKSGEITRKHMTRFFFLATKEHKSWEYCPILKHKNSRSLEKVKFLIKQVCHSRMGGREGWSFLRRNITWIHRVGNVRYKNLEFQFPLNTQPAKMAHSPPFRGKYFFLSSLKMI